EFAVIRSNHVLGPGGRWVTALVRQARSRLVVAPGTQLLAPVFVGDVAAVLAAADDRERLGSGTWALDGPERVTADRLTDLVAGLVRLEVDGAVGTIRLDRPPMNAINGDLLRDLHDVATEAVGNEEVRALVLYGGEKVFAAGADIKMMAGLAPTQIKPVITAM